jgi:uncharacterized protein
MKNLLLIISLLCCLSQLSAQPLSENYKEVDLNFVHKGDSIFGKLVIPEGVVNGKLPVIVFVHGSGPEDYSSSGNYDYLWQEFIKAGYACYSWDKPGHGRSEGQWYNQSINQRADEVISAINKIKSVNFLDSGKIGLWGISQAGWVMPLVAEQARIAFVICVSSPVTTAFDQELYRVESEMKTEGYSRNDIDKAIDYTRQCKRLVLEDKPYTEFLALQKEIENYNCSQIVIRGDEKIYYYLDVILHADSIPRINYYHCPVLAVWGENDLLVPPKKSAEYFRQKMAEINNPDFTIKIIPQADHTLTFNITGRRSETIERRELYKDNPSMIFAPGAVQLMADWLFIRNH